MEKAADVLDTNTVVDQRTVDEMQETLTTEVEDKNAKVIDDLKSFSKSLIYRKPKVSVQAEPSWLSTTLGRGLGGMLGNLAVPQPSSCRGCDLRSKEIEEHDKVVQNKNEELFEQSERIKELGGLLEEVAGVGGARGGKEEGQEVKEELSKMKEVLEAKEKSLKKKDRELERKKEEVKNMKLELIKVKEEMALKQYKHVPVEAQGARSKDKKKETKTNPTDENKRESKTKSPEAGFSCTKCDNKERSKSDLMIHMDTVHKEHEELTRGAE